METRDSVVQGRMHSTKSNKTWFLRFLQPYHSDSVTCKFLLVLPLPLSREKVLSHWCCELTMCWQLCKCVIAWNPQHRPGAILLFFLDAKQRRPQRGEDLPVRMGTLQGCCVYRRGSASSTYIEGVRPLGLSITDIHLLCIPISSFLSLWIQLRYGIARP